MLHPTVFRIATLMALASAAIAVAWTSPSAAAVPAAPEVLSAYATPSALGPSGGTVTVTGRVKNARSCQLELLSRQSFPVVYSHNATTACQNGTFSARVLIGGNRSPVKRSVAFALVARDGSLASTGLLYVSLAPLLAPSVLSAYATPSALGPSGGTVTVTGRVKNARSCQLELLSRQSFPVVYSHNATTACQNGTFSARVLIGGNPSPVKRSVAFALVARDGSLASTGLLYVSLAPLLAPSVLSAYATPSALGPSGGTVTVTGRVKNARSCQLELLSRQSFPVVYSHNATTACQNGTFSARVLIGGNPSPVKRSVAFALVASDGSLSSAGLLYVSLPPRPPYLPPPPPPPPLPSQYTPGSTGYDVSWPQCQASGSPLTKSLPNARTFAVVGVNNGTISGFNSCFGAEAAWAGQGLSVYIILQPAPSGGRPAIETSGPKSACAATNQQCAAYDWGYNYAEADLAFVRAQGLQPQILVARRRNSRGMGDIGGGTTGERGRCPGSPRRPHRRRQDGRHLLHLVPVGPNNGLVHATGASAHLGGRRDQPRQRLLQRHVVLPTSPVCWRSLHYCLYRHRVRRRHPLARAVRVHTGPGARR